MNIKGRLVRVLPPVLWASLIFYLSSIPSLKTPFGFWDYFFRKAAHFGVYFILALLITPNFEKGGSRWLYSALIASVYGILDEYHQSFVPGRFMTVSDMLLNASGAFTAGLLIKYADRRDSTCRKGVI